MLKTLILGAALALFVSAGCHSAKGAEIQTKTVTAYCGCEKCCGKWSKHKLTADGHTPKQGVTIAASRAIPFGTKIKIEGKIYTVQDRLATKYDNRIDIYFEKHDDALKFGKKTLQIEILDKK